MIGGLMIKNIYYLLLHGKHKFSHILKQKYKNEYIEHVYEGHSSKSVQENKVCHHKSFSQQINN